ncbi:hypothetical protein [Micromonospora sp. NPDC048830]|uniref:hypothetical protein n=1 Tax=Micromonospora sp. NPDC048830 TaxID=3364257 RepID=UPI00371BFDDE
MAPPPNLRRQFVWTVIPSGRVEPDGQQRALFSLLLTPKLIGPPGTRLTLGQFGMQSWPQRLAAVRFTAYRTDRQLTATPVPLVTEDDRKVQFTTDQQTAAWRQMFPATMPVRPHALTTYQGRRYHDFPARDAGAEIKSAFRATARTLAYLSGDDHEQSERRQTALRDITQSWQAAALGGPDADAATRAAAPLQRAYEFYRRDGVTPFEAEATAQELDFHDQVARLADHPILLRALGLLMDFAVPVPELTGAGANEIRVEPRWPSADPNPADGWAQALQEDVRPRTAYTLTGSRFVPAPSGGQRSPGMLPLAGTKLLGEAPNLRFEIVPFDVDGAALRMVAAARSDGGAPPSTAAPTAGLPALRSMGFALVDGNRKGDHEARLRRAGERDTPSKLEGSPLTADNLVAGYRVDVLDGGQWRSLCQRRVGYTVGSVQIGSGTGLLDEGYVRPESAATGAGAADALYIHETVARWTGWSLVVPRPERVDDQTGGATPPVPFTARVDLERGSLPRLRFGRTYRLRVRLVDLAGGGLRRQQVGADEEVTEPFVHRRFEPLLPPELAPTAPYVDGAGQDQMVIRSDRGVTADAYAARHGYRAVDLRYLYAPKSSLELALQHPTALDTALGPGAADDVVRRQFDLARRADGDLGDLGAVLTQGGGTEAGCYFVVPEAPAALPWLPDFVVASVAMRVRSRPTDPGTGGAGGTAGFDRFHFSWKGDWPDRRPIALKVVAAAAGCTARHSMVGNDRTFTVELGPAEQVTVDIVSCPAVDYVYSWLGVAYWAGASPHDTGHPVNASIYYGRNPLVTPPRTVTMVHAVQRPLRDPSGQLTAERSMGDTHAVLNTSKLAIDVRSTGRIDLRAEWTDIDDRPPAAPRRTAVAVGVGSYDIAHKPPLVAPPNGAFPRIRQEFADTRRRKVRYTVAAISRFRDYFQRVTDRDTGACTVHGTLDATDVPSTARPPAPKVRGVIPTFRWSRSDGGTVIRSSRRGGGLRVLLERPWFATGVEEALAVVVWPQPASPPAVRELAYLSLAGRDPLRTTAAPAAILDPGHFTATVKESVHLPELGKTVTAVVTALDFDRNYDKDADCWFADLDLAPLAEAAYFPFVQLALCRYQAETADRGQRLSPPIRTEPLQLFPHRDLTVTRGAGRVTVVLTSPSPGGAAPTTVRAELQAFAGDPRGASDGLIGASGWTTLTAAAGKLGDSLALDVPQAQRRPLRIAVTETESYAGGDAGTASRIVHADTVALAPAG